MAPLEDVLPPTRYIEKVCLATGEPVAGEIAPDELLVQSHRDYHVVDVYARSMMSWLIDATGNEELIRQTMKEVRKLGHRAASILTRLIPGLKDPERLTSTLFGLRHTEFYFRFKRPPFSKREIHTRLRALRAAARSAHAANGGEVRVLLTGGTGFVGKEILAQVVREPAVTEVVVLIRPKTVRDRDTKEIVKVLSPEERGQKLLDQLWLRTPEERAKFRFIAGDIEAPQLGVAEDERERLATRLTHVIHCAASVSFDDPYESSFRANVAGSLNALAFSLALQEAEGSPFVAHLGIETSYIHGRQTQQLAREDEIVFPRNFYNNFYELTKAMASLETERFMFEKGLRVVQLCPAIVIGDSKNGNNRGDLKVVNAPVNVFGRTEEALKQSGGSWRERSTTRMIASMAAVFPGDACAELNLIPVDWVVAGIVAALKEPEAIGERIHLATDNRITAEQIQTVVLEELGLKITLAEPTIHRNVRLPVLTRVLKGMSQPKLAGALEKLGQIFGGYSEWGQPVHQVGNDVEILGLPEERPDTVQAFRMLCRHNKYVQKFGKIRDLDEISRREKVWADFIEELERATGKRAGEVDASHFTNALELAVDLGSFTLESVG